VERNANSSEPAKKEAAAKLSKKITEVLETSDHNWYINKMDPAEQALREQQRKEFQQRYSK
jgi:hydroxylamine dehydrogenase